MAHTYICRLFFRNALQVGAAKSGVGLESTEGPIIHSDTLWAAICNHWAVIGKVKHIEFDDFLNSFKIRQPIFTLSSAFPFTDDTYYWMPRPLMNPFLLSSNDDDAYQLRLAYGPAIKEKRFILIDHWIQWNQQYLDLEALTLSDENEQIADTLRPYNTVDRKSGRTAFFHAGLTYFDPDRSGLYFLLRLQNDEVKTAIAEILEIIKQTSGFGGNRNTGPGALERYEILPADADWTELSNTPDDSAFCLLSLYHPASVETAANQALAYNLIQRKGWTGSLSTGRQYKYQTVWMFAEGSVFQTIQPQGHLVDVTPQNIVPAFPHDVFRNGLAFAFPLRLKPEGDCHV